MNVKIDEMWPGLAWPGFNVWVLGDVRAQAGSQAACPDILEPTGAGSVVTITKYFLISTQFSQYLYQLHLLVLPTLELFCQQVDIVRGGRGNPEWFQDKI